ncbi:hypothetical protein GCM10028816_05080 [Spirosoma lituiforme]
MKTVNVGDPVGFSRELDRMFNTFTISGKHAKAAFENKGVMLTGKTFLKSSLPTFDFPLGDSAFEVLPFLFGKGQVGFKIRYE